jgi:hypothetical protein
LDQRYAKRRGEAVRKTLFVAVVSCLFMFAVSTGALAVVSRTIAEPVEEAGGQAPEYTLIVDAEDYLVDVEGVVTFAEDLTIDQLFLVKRGSDLKWTVFDTPGGGNDYTKVVYTTNVRLRDIALFTAGVAGLALSDVTIEGFSENLPTMVSASLAINGEPVLLAEGGALDASNYITWVFDSVTGTLSARVTLPSLDLTTALAYENGDVVSLFVMFKTPVTGLNIAGSEIAFPDYQ